MRKLAALGLLFVCLLSVFLIGGSNSAEADPTTGNILLFVAYNDVWWAEYKVLYEGLIAAGYTVDVRSSAMGEAYTYGANVEASANDRDSYADFTTLFATNFSSTWDSAWNTPANIPIDGLIQDVVNLDNYDAFVIPGGTGSLNYRYDGSYAAFGPAGHQTTAVEVQAAAEKINQLINEALQSGKPVGSQCHGGTIVPFARLDGTSGQGFDGLGRSVLEGGYATAYHLGDGDSASVYSSLGVNYLPNETLVIDGPSAADLGSLNGQDMVVTTRDWYPQTVAYFGRTILNMIESYPTPAERAAAVDILVYGGFEPDNYSGSEPDFSPALYTEVATLLNDATDEFSFTATALQCNNSIDAATLNNYDVLLNFCHINIDGTTENVIEQWVDDGGGLVGLHHAIWHPGYNNPVMIDLIGGELPPAGLNLQYFGSENRLINVNVGEFVSTWGVHLTAGEPTTSTHYAPAASFNGTLPNANIDGDGSRGYWHLTIPANDELYVTARFNAGATFGRGVNDLNRLFANDWNGATNDFWGWTRLYDGDGDGNFGRIVFLEPGETMERTFAHAGYVQVVKNAVLWTTLNRPAPNVPPTPTPSPTPSPTPQPSLASLSDGFDSAATASNWIGGNANAHSIRDINSSNAGMFTFAPDNTSGNAWYNNGEAPIFYKTVSGNFLITAHVLAGNSSDPQAAPSGTYQSAGLIARDPASDSGNEDHVFYSLGHDSIPNGIGTDMRSTDNGNSTLNFTSSGGENSGQLALCRVGDQFLTYRMLDGGAWEATQSVTRTDLPSELQVGVALNSWSTHDLLAQVDYVTFREVGNSAECLSLLVTPTNTITRQNTTHSTQSTIQILCLFLLLAFGTQRLHVWKGVQFLEFSRTR